MLENYRARKIRSSLLLFYNVCWNSLTHSRIINGKHGWFKMSKFTYTQIFCLIILSAILKTGNSDRRLRQIRIFLRVGPRGGKKKEIPRESGRDDLKYAKKCSDIHMYLSIHFFHLSITQASFRGKDLDNYRVT